MKTPNFFYLVISIFWFLLFCVISLAWVQNKTIKSFISAKYPYKSLPQVSNTVLWYLPPEEEPWPYLHRQIWTWWWNKCVRGSRGGNCRPIEARAALRGGSNTQPSYLINIKWHFLKWIFETQVCFIKMCK